MADTISSLSRLSTAVYRLKLLDQGLEKLKTEENTTLLFQTEHPKKPEVFDSTKTIQSAIDTIKAFEGHLKDISPTAKAIAPKILKNATSELNKIKNILKKLPTTPHKTDLSTSIDSCASAITHAHESLVAIKIEGAQKTLGWIPRLAAVLGNVVYPLLNPSAELDRINKRNLEYKAELNTLAGSDAPIHFADSVSQFTIAYLEEHLMHVNERDPSLRPPFLEFFFDKLYTDHPEENKLCTLVKKALTEHKPLMQATVELNLLKGLKSAYTTLHNIEDKSFLVDLTRNSFHLAIESVQKEEEARKQGGINPLTLEERNQLLMGTFQKELVQFMLDFAFPNGADDLELPQVLSSKIPMVNLAMSELKTQLIWPLVQKGLETLTQSIFSELSADENVKNQILIQGYTQANAWLEKRTTEPIGALRGMSQVSAIPIGIVATFFRIIFNAFNAPPRQTSPYPQQKDLDDDLYKAMEWTAEGSKLLKLIFKRFGRRIADSAGVSVTNALKNIEAKDFLNQQLDSITQVLNTEGETLFPRTEQAEDAIKQNREKMKEKNKETLKSLRSQFSKNIDGLISQITDAIYPPLNETDITRARMVVRQFCRSCLFYFIHFVAWTIGLKRKMKKIEERLFTVIRRMDQDAVLMSVTRGTTEKISQAKKNQAEG